MKTEDNNYASVTEVPGEEITSEQLNRMHSRYFWAAEYCRGKDVLEVACGPGVGLGYLLRVAKTLECGDIFSHFVQHIDNYYGNRVKVSQFDAHELPFPDESKDVILFFEAIYYLKLPEKFISEAKRVLRPGGLLLIVTANKDLYDFHKSPFSYQYYGVIELRKLLSQFRFETEFFGDSPISSSSMLRRLVRPLKRFAAKRNLIPKTMAGKKFLKRVIFGSLLKMPAEIQHDFSLGSKPMRLTSDEPNYEYQVLFCLAKKS